MDFAFALVNSVVLVKMTLRLVLVLALHPAFVLKKKRAKITRGPQMLLDIFQENRGESREFWWL